MSITSVSFVLFIIAVILLYYIVPKRIQWLLLLVSSLFFYLILGITSSIYVIITATTIYCATCRMQVISDKQRDFFQQQKDALTKDDKKIRKEKDKKHKKRIMICTLLVNIGILCFFKYSHFAIEQYNSIVNIFGGKTITDNLKYIIPLGISFYTFQSVGYLLDVYWGYYKPEKNYLKVLLFVTFFPQMTQGPISEFEALSKELFSEHKFTYKNFSYGFQRLLWGFVKKMVLANMLAPMVEDVFANYSAYAGVSVLIGAFMYSIQIYADFSGYMDIMCGFCEMLGIKLSENFQRPYFSKSIAEYWRRWHITLGAWFKKYIYYPIGMSSWSRKLSKAVLSRYGKHFANTIPATIALTVTWLATGLWHGASWAYISWGLVNGLFIIVSLWMEPVYEHCKTTLKINESRLYWRIFQVLRTFILVTFIKVLPEVGTLSEGFGLWKQVFTNHTVPTSIRSLLPFAFLNTATHISYLKLAVIAFVTLLFFAMSILQRKNEVRCYFNKLPRMVRIILLVFLFILIAIFGIKASNTGGGFMYANF